MGHNVLVVGGGGREYELVRQAGLSDDVEQIYSADGNAGIGELPKTKIVGIKPTDLDGMVNYANYKDALTIIGPEAPLVLGMADRLRAQGLLAFGPSAEAARLESSKGYAVRFMERHGIACPPSLVTASASEALTFINQLGGAGNSVIKADGLAGGKGVVLPENNGTIGADEKARETVHAMLSGQLFDGAGKNAIVIQERYHGPEVSVFAISDGERFTILPAAQDHKRLLDGDEGPNTGGMGAYAPVPLSILSVKQEGQIYEIAQRTIEGMSKEGVPYQGALYLGIMLAEELDGDPVVIEYNARFGDPETQVVLPILEKSGVDVYDLVRSAAEGKITNDITWSNLGGAALTVCLAAEGYPEKPRKDDIIRGLNQPYVNTIVHHAGTKNVDGETLTNGGRVLYVTGLGQDVDNAVTSAYEVVLNNMIDFDGAQYRRDIGHQARTKN